MFLPIKLEMNDKVVDVRADFENTILVVISSDVLGSVRIVSVKNSS